MDDRELIPHVDMMYWRRKYVELEAENQRLRGLLKEIWYWYQNDGPGVLTYWADDLEKELADDT